MCPCTAQSISSEREKTSLRQKYGYVERVWEGEKKGALSCRSLLPMWNREGGFGGRFKVPT